MSYFYVACTVLLTVYGQLVIKWQVLAAGAFPEMPGEKMLFLARLLVNPWIVSALAAALLAAMSWMAALTTRLAVMFIPWRERGLEKKYRANSSLA